eukprot:1156723-Pelagomonas_calceolata.AAC.24
MSFLKSFAAVCMCVCIYADISRIWTTHKTAKESRCAILMGAAETRIQQVTAKWRQECWLGNQTGKPARARTDRQARMEAAIRKCSKQGWMMKLHVACNPCCPVSAPCA